MNYETIDDMRFTIAGIAARVSNGKPDDIGALWQRFYAEDVATRVTNRASDDIYSLYTEYDSDFSQPYTLAVSTGHCTTCAQATPA